MYLFYPFLKEIPLVRILLIFIIGITLGIHLPNNEVAITLFIISIIILITAIFIRSSYQLKSLQSKSTIVTSLLFISMVSLGYISATFHYQFNLNKHYSNFIDEKAVVKINIQSPIIIKGNSIKIEGEIIEVLDSNICYQTKGKIIAYIEKDSNSLLLKYGDIITGSAYINLIDAPKNPHEFNYKNYLKFHNIYHSAYFNSTKWKKNKESKSNYIVGKILNIRAYLAIVIDNFIEGEREQAIANAILIGKKDLLDAETVRAYSSSGAMHVLAVSGLHVGIVYLVFSYTLVFLDKTKYKQLKPILLILLIWFYAILTGASPSVLRAATMFSFISIGKSMQQHVNIYNMIAASAFILILFNPYIITEVGFQLSYLAVIGIIYLQPKIYNLLIPKNWLLDKIWTITAVSIAAQIATFPLGLLYFHQFPNFFWVSNLIVIPAAIIIVHLGVALFVFSCITPLAWLFGKILSCIIWALNQSVSFIDHLPYSLSSEIHINLLETYCIYVAIIFLSMAIYNKNKMFLKIAITSSLIFTVSYSGKYWNLNAQKTLTVYYVPKTSAFELNDAFTTYSFFDENFIKNESQLLFRVKHNWWAKHINKQEFIHLKNAVEKITFANKTILIIDSNYKMPEKKIIVDYAIIKHEPKIYLEYFSAKIKANKYIFDSSNRPYRLKYWKKDCEELNLDCYFVSENKAFIEKLN